MFQTIKVTPFVVDGVAVDSEQPSDDHLKLVNARLKCKTDLLGEGEITISDLQYSWLEFLCALAGPISGIPLYIEKLYHPFSTLLGFKFTTYELKLQHIKNELKMDKIDEYSDNYWEDCLGLLNVVDSYPKYIQDICLDWMEQAIFHLYIPYNHLLSISEIYSQRTLDTRLSCKYINEEKTIEHLLATDSFEIEKLILPSELLVSKCLSNIQLYVKIIKLWSVIPNHKGIFEFDLTLFFLKEIDVLDRDDISWTRLVILIDFCRYLNHKTHFYFLLHIFMHSLEWMSIPSKPIPQTLHKLKQLVISVILEIIEPENIDSIIKTILNPKDHPLKDIQPHFSDSFLLHPSIFAAFEYLLPYCMPSVSLLPDLLKILVQKQIHLTDTLKPIKSVLIHMNEVNRSLLFDKTELIVSLFSFKYTPRNETYYEVLRVYLSLILTSDSESDIDSFYFKLCTIINNFNSGIHSLPSFECDLSVVYDMMSSILADQPPLQLKSIESTWHILQHQFNLADIFFESYISFILYLLHSKRLVDFNAYLHPLYNLSIKTPPHRIIHSCQVLCTLIMTAPTLVEDYFKQDSKLVKELFLLLNHPIADVYWSVSQVLFYLIVTRKWIAISTIKDYWELVNTCYWNELLLLLCTEDYSLVHLRQLEIKQYHALYLSTMNDQLPESKQNHFDVLLNITQTYLGSITLPKMTPEYFIIYLDQQVKIYWNINMYYIL